MAPLSSRQRLFSCSHVTFHNAASLTVTGSRNFIVQTSNNNDILIESSHLQIYCFLLFRNAKKLPSYVQQFLAPTYLHILLIKKPLPIKFFFVANTLCFIHLFTNLTASGLEFLYANVFNKGLHNFRIIFCNRSIRFGFLYFLKIKNVFVV